ncbi:MAG: HPr family phosphocarrier protein [Planctomycetota bacterium]|nr:MAG: HPr family phosphocarrier protein [Planctomycetota bacterium]
MKESIDCQRSVTVGSKFGLHMRVAQQVVRAAQRFHSTLTIRHDAILADARSILSILILGALHGVVLDLHATGPDAEEAITEIAHLINADLDDVEYGKFGAKLSV